MKSKSIHPKASIEVLKKVRGRLLSEALVAVLCVFLASLYAVAQTTGLGNITGVITDISGAAITGVPVTITNISTNVSHATVSNKTGYFEVDSLVPGVYRIAVAAPGFESLVQEGITLQTGASLSVSLQLRPGHATETVTVHSDATLLNTESGSMGQVLTTKQLESLPVSGSNPAWFIDLAPGVQTAFSQTASVDGTLNWNGVSNWGVAGVLQKNEYSLDGGPNMQNRANGINPTGDELDEMKIDVVGMDASVGHTMGGSITQTTKSGTNQLHGRVRWNYENKRWSALNHFEGLNYKYQLASHGCTNGPSTSPECKQIEDTYGFPGVHENNGAGSLGGPIYIPHVIDGHNKLFFFVSVLDDVFSGTGSATISIPTLQERKGDFSDLPAAGTPWPALIANACPAGTPFYGQYQLYDPFSTALDANGIPRRTPFCGNVIPASRMTNSAMVNLYNGLLPAPTQNSPTGNNYNYDQTRPQTYRTYTTREDFAISQSDHLFVRYTRANYTNDTSGFTVGDVDLQVGPRWIDVAAIGWNHIFSAKTNLDFTVGGTNFKTHCCYYPGYEKYTPGDLGLPSYTNTYAGAEATLPVLSVSNYQQIGQVNNSVQFFRDFAFRANVTHVAGRHTIRAGGEFRFQDSSQAVQGNTSGTYSFDDTYTQENNGRDSSFTQSNTGLSYAAFLMGTQTSSAVSQQAPYSLSTPYYALYAGDTWRVNRKLTFIPGIRYEFEYGLQEKHNEQIVGWNPTASLPIAGPANTAYQAALAAATPTQQAVLPQSLNIEGGPIYAGVNGAPTRAWVNSWRIMPRLAAAYQFDSHTVLHGGYGLFFDTMNALLGGADQDGFSSSTSVPSSTTFGTNFTAGAPPIGNPFPVGANGTRFNAPVGSSAGSLYYVGSGPTINQHSLVPAREQRGYLGLQRQFGDSTMLEVAWMGALITNLSMSKSYTYPPAPFYAAGQQPNTVPNGLLGSQIANPFLLSNFGSLATSNPAAYGLMSLNGYFTSPTVSVGNLVRAYPQMSGLSLNQPIGESKFQQIQVNVQRRYSQGLTLMGEIQFTHDNDRDYFANAFDPSPSWEASNNAVPVRVTAEGVWNLPFGRGHGWADSGWKSAVFGGFQLSGTWEAQTGQLINFGNLFYIGNINASNIKIKNPIYVNDQPSGGSNYVQWLNPGNVVATATTLAQPNGTTTTVCTYNGTGFVTNPQCQPTSYNLRAFPTRLNGVRQMGWDGVNANLQREFPVIRDKMTFQARFETYNLFNHQVISAPDSTPTDATFGQVTSDGFPGQNGRWINISGYLRF